MRLFRVLTSLTLILAVETSTEARRITCRDGGSIAGSRGSDHVKFVRRATAIDVACDVDSTCNGQCSFVVYDAIDCGVGCRQIVPVTVDLGTKRRARATVTFRDVKVHLVCTGQCPASSK